MLWKRLRRRYTKGMEIDSDKVQAQLNRLNRGLARPVWEVSTSQFYALTTVTFKPDGSASFNPAQGHVGLAFINSSTGEIKIFHLNAFRITNG